jgi:hypothetical protein
MTRDTKEVAADKVPNFALVVERIHAINPKVEFVKAGQDKDLDTFTLRLQLVSPRQTDLCLPENLLSDLTGRNNAHRKAQLEQLIQSALGRLK